MERPRDTFHMGLLGGSTGTMSCQEGHIFIMRGKRTPSAMGETGRGFSASGKWGTPGGILDPAVPSCQISGLLERGPRGLPSPQMRDFEGRQGLSPRPSLPPWLLPQPELQMGNRVSLGHSQGVREVPSGTPGDVQQNKGYTAPAVCVPESMTTRVGLM